MNLILFEPGEVAQRLPLSDGRARHLLSVLRLGPGDSFDAGIVNGPRGKGRILGVGDAAVELEFTWLDEPPPLYPLTLVLGLPRPQTARKVLEEATALGVSQMHFVKGERGEAGYLQSRLWSTPEWRRRLIDGAQQAFSTRLPDVLFGADLASTLDLLPSGACRIALDNYEAPLSLAETPLSAPLVLALGPEHGWSPVERALLREGGFRLTHLGERVLRVETACVAAVAIARARLQLL